MSEWKVGDKAWYFYTQQEETAGHSCLDEIDLYGYEIKSIDTVDCAILHDGTWVMLCNVFHSKKEAIDALVSKLKES